jgi:hypothetical protein
MTTTRPVPPTATDDDEERALEASGALARAAAAFRHALDDVHAADDAAWRAYSASLDDATRRLEAELAVARVQLDTERAAHADSVHDAVVSAGDALQERIDTLRVRAHIGRMDVESGLARTVADLERRAAEVRAASRRARETTTADVEEARRAAWTVLDDIVELFRLAGAVVRDDLVTPRPSPDDQA